MKLDLVNAKRFIDVGAGTGSVSVEAAYNYPNLEVISIERNDDALDLINKNVEKFNLKNVEVIKAYAPIDIEGEVDAIFLGGTGNRLNEILLWSKEKLVPGGRLVANFIIVETFNETLRLLREYGFENIDVSVMNISKLEKECIESVNRNNVTEEEVKKWLNISAKMYLPYDEELDIIVQHDDFLDKEFIKVKDLPKCNLPLNQNWSWDKILRSCFIKQADVLQGIYYFSDKFTFDEKKRNFD